MSNLRCFADLKKKTVIKKPKSSQKKKSLDEVS